MGGRLADNSRFEVRRFDASRGDKGLRWVPDVSRKGSIEHLRVRGTRENTQSQQQHCTSKFQESAFLEENISTAPHNSSGHNTPSTQMTQSIQAPWHPATLLVKLFLTQWLYRARNVRLLPPFHPAEHPTSVSTTNPTAPPRLPI